MDKPGPPRPPASARNGKGKELRASLDDEPTAVALPPSDDSSAAAADLEVTVADPVTDLLATTELPALKEALAASEEPEPVEEEDPNKAYLAPQAIPTPAVPDNDDGRRVVLNLPDQDAVLPPSPHDVDRARRRAPTVKIPRGTLAARNVASARATVPEIALPPPPPPAPRQPMIAVAEDAAAPEKASPPLSLPVLPRDTPTRERRAEPPPTARHVSDPPQRSRSRLPLVALAAICIGGGAFAIFSLGGGADATKVSDASGPAGRSPEKAPAPTPPPPPTQPERPIAAPPVVETAAPPITLSAEPTPEPVSTQAVAGNTPPPKATPPTFAGQPAAPPRPPAAVPAPPSPPRPPAAAPPKPPKPGDYTPPTI